MRGFFDLSAEEEELPPAEEEVTEEETEESWAEDPAGEDTQVMDRSELENMDDTDDTQIIRRPGPLSENWDTRGDRGS